LAEALAAGTGLDAYDVKATPKVLKSLGQRGFDVTEARHGNHIEIVATPFSEVSYWRVP